MRCRALKRAALVVGLVLGVTPACLSQVGHPNRATPDALYEDGLDLGTRGDLVGAMHLLERAERTGAGSYFGILATLQRHRIGRTAVRDTMAGAPGAVELVRHPLQACPGGSESRDP